MQSLHGVRKLTRRLGICWGTLSDTSSTKADPMKMLLRHMRTAGSGMMAPLQTNKLTAGQRSRMLGLDSDSFYDESLH